LRAVDTPCPRITAQERLTCPTNVIMKLDSGRNHTISLSAMRARRGPPRSDETWKH
jgi:hypothetical protein